MTDVNFNASPLEYKGPTVNLPATTYMQEFKAYSGAQTAGLDEEVFEQEVDTIVEYLIDLGEHYTEDQIIQIYTAAGEAYQDFLETLTEEEDSTPTL